MFKNERFALWWPLGYFLSIYLKFNYLRRLLKFSNALALSSGRQR